MRNCRRRRRPRRGEILPGSSTRKRGLSRLPSGLKSEPSTNLPTYADFSLLAPLLTLLFLRDLACVLANRRQEGAGAGGRRHLTRKDRLKRQHFPVIQ